MLVGIDVSPLRQTRAGTARYLDGLLPHLERLVDVERLAWGGGGRVTAAVRDAWWYPVALPRRARNVDVLHCPSFRAPCTHEPGMARRAGFQSAGWGSIHAARIFCG